MSDRSDKIANAARRLDDFIIDRLLQPSINRAEWHLGLNIYTLARICAVLGAGIGFIWVRRYDAAYSPDFWQDLLCLIIMLSAAFLQIRANEAARPRRAAFAPAVRLTGLLWRSLWLADLLLLPSQLPLQTPREMLGDLIWTALLVLPYWIICCRPAPPPEPRVAAQHRYATIPIR